MAKLMTSAFTISLSQKPRYSDFTKTTDKEFDQSLTFQTTKEERFASLGNNYDCLGVVPATQSPSYNVVATTLADSPAVETYLITAHTSDPSTYYLSDPASGYSVDNLAPAVVVNVLVIKSESSVALSWSNNSDPDIKEYEIHRATKSDFTPNPLSKIGATNTTNFTDNNPALGYRNYYSVIARDIHNNPSNPSAITTAEYPTDTSQYVTQNWNMISVPIEVSDWSKMGLYPTSVSNAYSYHNGYIVSDPLAHGVGYWLKFNNAESVPHTGYLKDIDSIQVNVGWNMIGSISSPISVTDIVSEPASIVTSPFFGYNNGYSNATTIEPGKAYWVKVSETGKLILSTSPTAKQMNGKIKIAPTNELPPPPPEGTQNVLNEIPKEYSMDQNYPNPFNPSTTIKYGLPEQAHVTLTVHNTLGQQVTTLVNEQQKEGYHEVVFSNPNLPSGVYFYRLSVSPFATRDLVPTSRDGQTGTYTDTKKLLLIK